MRDGNIRLCNTFRQAKSPIAKLLFFLTFYTVIVTNCNQYVTMTYPQSDHIGSYQHLSLQTHMWKHLSELEHSYEP